MKMGRVKYLGFCLIMAMLPVSAMAQLFEFENTSLLDAISEIEEETPYRFLYREAQVTGMKVTFSCSRDSLFHKLRKSLSSGEVRLKVDELQKQVLIYKTPSPAQEKETFSVSGFIVDGETGERLPFSTISWNENGTFRGVAANASGAFELISLSTSGSFTFTVSFVGYKSQKITLQPENITGLTVRLTPHYYSGKEIIVRGFNFYTPSDTVLSGLLKTGSFNPLGEANSIRTLQLLPSVSTGTAVNDGVNIRGSSSDGLQVLLDGMNIYNQDHLFGLLDAMNSDVLKTSGFHYDITPAQFQAPPGGTLSLITRTGSLQSIQGSAGISNTALKSTFEGPFKQGRASWIVSGRYSFMDQLNLLGNRELIEYGLGVDRPADITDSRLSSLSGNPLRWEAEIIHPEVNETHALFYDLHAKTYLETESGSQFILSGYVGQDQTRQSYNRPLANDPDLEFETLNDWESQTFTARFNSRISNRLVSESSAGLSAYYTNFRKDDFHYQVSEGRNNRIPDTVRVAPLRMQNDLREFNLEQTFNYSLDGYRMYFGASYSDFVVEYLEQNFPQASFRTRRTSQLADLFYQLDIIKSEDLNLFLGSRLHYFSNGQYIRWSPRLKAHLFPGNELSLSAGYSKNYQFLHQVGFHNINSADFWILSNEDQPPSSMNYFTSSLQYRLSAVVYIQAEAYLKKLENLRLHQLNTALTSDSFQNNESPFFTRNSGTAKGVEFLAKTRLSPLVLTATYTLSSVLLENEAINNGVPFYPEWDRRHQVNFISEIELLKGFRAYLSTLFATGNPDRLQLRDGRSRRLNDYWRTDLSLNYTLLSGNNRLETTLSVYNLFNRKNDWYSEVAPVLLTRERFNGTETQRQGVAETTVFDLGFHPSFNLTFYF